MIKKAAKVKPNYHIITAYAESAAGPGWSNTPIWVVLKDKNTNKITIECIQPENQTKEMLTIYRIAESVHNIMVDSVSKVMKLKGE